MISLDKCSGSCNILSSNIYVPIETKDINLKAFNMITKEMKLKQWQNMFHVTANENSNGITKLVNINVKMVVLSKKIIVGIISHVFVRIASIQNLLLILQ